MTNDELLAVFDSAAADVGPEGEAVQAGMRAVAAAAWNEAIEAARSVLHRRAPAHYETDIDLIVEPNPYSQNALVTDERTKK